MPKNEKSNFCLIKQYVDVWPLVNELTNTNLWTVDIERQNNIFVQSETQTIYIRKAKTPSLNSKKTFDMHESVITKNAEKLPLIFGWVNRFSEEVCGHLGRVLIVRLKPNGKVYKHIDSGDYYQIRDRFHLVLKSEKGTIFICEKEKVVMREGEVWWFDNKKMHEVINPSNSWRIHLIFDILNASW